MYTNNSLPTGRSDFHQDYCRNNCRWWNLCNTIHPLHHYAHHHTVSCRVLVSWKVYVEYKAVWGCTRRHCSVRTLCVYLCKNKSVVLTTQWSPWLHKSQRDMQWSLKTNCLRQPESQLLSSSYNHNTLTTLSKFVRESPACILRACMKFFLLQLWSASVILHWRLS